MKNLKNVFLALMVGFLVIGFISCDQPTGSPKTEVENESGEDSGEVSGEIYYYMYNGELAGGKNTLEDFNYEVELYGLVESEDYTIDHENKLINFTESGYNKIN